MPAALSFKIIQLLLVAPIWLGWMGISLADNGRNPEVMDSQLRKVHEYFLKAKGPLYDDPELQSYVEAVGHKMVKASDTPDAEYFFFVQDIEGVDAYTPGYGLVYISRGLLALMTSEGQLAGVLAHEIGHNVGRHTSRLKSRATMGNIGEFLASLLARNSNVGSAIALRNQEKERAFGREMELEADEYGAKYLYNAGYDPQEMLSMLGLLKDHATFTDKRLGTQLASYHGVFATHPRADKRLQEVINKAGQLPPGEAFRGRAELRNMLEGVVVGANHTGNKRDDQERFTHRGMGITFLHPNDWSRNLKGNKIVLKDARKAVQLKITVSKTKDKSLNSQQILEATYSGGLYEVEKIDEKATKDLGTVGRLPQQRVAVIRVGRNTFEFQGIARNNQLTSEQDQQMLEIIKSFRRATRQDLSPDDVKRLTFKRLEPGETFASLAKSRELGKYTEDYLRVMNGYYPKGEAEPGTYIKVIMPEKPKGFEPAEQE